MEKNIQLLINFTTGFIHCTAKELMKTRPSKGQKVHLSFFEKNRFNFFDGTVDFFMIPGKNNTTHTVMLNS